MLWVVRSYPRWRAKRKSCLKHSVPLRTYPATYSRFAAQTTWTGFITAKETTLGQYASEYGSVDALQVKSVATESELERAKAEASAAEDVPEEYMNVSDPAAYLERLQQTQRDARSQQNKALSEKAAAEANLERFRDEMTEDPNEAVYNAEHRFAEQKELLAHWKHIDSVFAEHRAALSSSPMSDIAERFAQNLELISGGRDAAELPNGNKLDFNVYSADRLVDYGKLSEGTKDTVSLAFRLAVLDHLFPDGGGVIVLDDPCTDMDEGRDTRSRVSLYRNTPVGIRSYSSPAARNTRVPSAAT